MKNLIFFSVVSFSLFLVSCGPKTREERIIETVQKIHNDPEWMKDVVIKAAERNLPVDTQVLRNAEWQIDVEDGLHK